jgi:putative membrane protein
VDVTASPTSTGIDPNWPPAPAGRLVAIAVPVIALATAVVSGVPTTLSTAAGYLPTYGSVSVVRTLTAHGGAATAGIAFTLGWLAVGALGVLLATASRRTTRSPLRLDPPSRLASAAD